MVDPSSKAAKRLGISPRKSQYRLDEYNPAAKPAGSTTPSEVRRDKP